jgi:hypothetical protein
VEVDWLSMCLTPNCLAVPRSLGWGRCPCISSNKAPRQVHRGDQRSIDLTSGRRPAMKRRRRRPHRRAFKATEAMTTSPPVTRQRVLHPVHGCAARPCGRLRIPRIGPVGMLWICCGQRGAGFRSRAFSAIRAQRLLFAGAGEGSEGAGEGCC